MTSCFHFSTETFTRFSNLPFLPPRKSDSYAVFCISYEETQNKRLIYKPIKLNL